jgi:type I restriction enzyme, S subunit
LQSIKVVIPPVREQLEIIAKINCDTQLIESSTKKTQLSVEYLQNYRQALIAAAVTGKIDVREEGES